MRRLGWFTLIGFLTLASGGSATVGGARPRTDRVSGTFSGKTVSAHSSTCKGADGKYLDQRFVAKGTETSSDSRLSGTFISHSRILVNLRKGIGRSKASVVITNPSTGAVKARFTFYAVGAAQPDGSVILKGMEIGTLRDGSVIFLNSTDVGKPDGTFSGEFGRKAGPIDLSVIQQGSCT